MDTYLPDFTQRFSVAGENPDSVVFTAKDISRYYGKYCALEPTDLALLRGELVLLSGQNGAGKSTLLNCLCGLLRPSSGQVEVGGYDLYNDEVEAKKRLAYVPDVPRFYTELTAWEHLKFVAMAHDAMEGFDARAAGLLKMLGLWEGRDLYPHNYSRGMSLKLGVALALVRPFQVLIMDEPTSALDPESVDQVVNLLGALRDRGSAVLFTSHNLALVEELHAAHWHMQAGVLKVVA